MLKFKVASEEQAKEIEFSLEIDCDGDLVLLAKRGGLSQKILWLSASKGTLGRFTHIPKTFGFALDETLEDVLRIS